MRLRLSPIISATPGRLVDHLENTKGFNLRSLKYLVLDEADRILNMDFEVELEKIIRVIPKERHTFLFSATMTKKVRRFHDFLIELILLQVSKLERASLKDPARIEVSSKYQTVETLQQSFMFIPFKYKVRNGYSSGTTPWRYLGSISGVRAEREGR